MRPWPFISLIGTVAVCSTFLVNLWFSSSVPKRSLPIFTTIEEDFIAVERSGQTVHIASLRGSVCAFAYLYTVCPHGCAAVVGEMSRLKETHGSRPDFQLVSVSVLPERDQPEFFRNYAEAIGVKPTDPWWFLRAERPAMEAFMTGVLKLEAAKAIPPDERFNPLEVYEHDLRIVLVDRQQRVRGYYAVFHPQQEIANLMRERLHSDTLTLLDEPITTTP
ncbi:SCO1/SenC [Prosthecobacter debontii]|uniref:SCO1/SenC n=1 Tax=Prosthecobacter debontii TaxID=48467 RepID=A0A1T4YIU7_9BACT|nr:SCO family protein [Prosthecobacter debontii]SKB01767.1 SCO1/SenC [Prosthecobacter debontii]